MSKIIKGVGKAVKSIAKGAKRVFKKITSSTIGKVILVAAAIWLGGAALGAWKSGFAAVDGALVGGGAGGTAGGLAGGAEGVSASAAASNAAAAASVPAGIETVSVVGTATPGLTAGQVAGAAGTAAAATTPTATATPQVRNVDLSGVQGTAEQAAAAGAEQGSKGLISKLMNPVKKRATWAGDHPLPTMMAINGIGTALSPDAIDLAREQENQDAKARKRWEDNLSVGNIDLGFRPSGQTLQYNNGAPVFDPVTGAISRQTRRT